MVVVPLGNLIADQVGGNFEAVVRLENLMAKAAVVGSMPSLMVVDQMGENFEMAVPLENLTETAVVIGSFLNLMVELVVGVCS